MIFKAFMYKKCQCHKTPAVERLALLVSDETDGFTAYF
jgi:hypothetical protein